MRVVVLCNRKSGKGRGERVAGEIASAMREDGHNVAEVAPGDGADLRGLLTASENAKGGGSLLVVVGGDGTVHHALPALTGTGVPLYHCPLGTENLFSREFGTDRTVATLRRAIRRGRVVDVDLGWAEPATTANGEARPPSAGDGGPAGGTLFAIMCSIGVDAGVIHRLTRTRTGAISHLSYVRPIIAEIVSPTMPRVSVAIDGSEVVREQTGVLVVGNMRQYAVRLNPARDARTDDGLLDVVFLPAKGRIGLVKWAALLRLGAHIGRRGVVAARGRTIEITSSESTDGCCQIDGEASTLRPPIRLSTRPGALRVLSARPD